MSVRVCTRLIMCVGVGMPRCEEFFFGSSAGGTCWKDGAGANEDIHSDIF